MKKFIVNADDFGLTYGVSLGIIEAFNKGVVRSASVMVNLPNIEEFIELMKKQAPGLDLGVHLNLTFGKPAAPLERVLSLIDENGFFWRKPDIVVQKANKDEIRIELITQTRKALSLESDFGINFSHIDSHHHIHRKKEVFDIYFKIAKDFNLSARSNDIEMSEFFKENQIKTPDFFIEEFYGAEKVTLENFKKIIEKLSDGSTELCCHPGKFDSELAKISSYTAEREKELAIYTSPEILDYLKKYNVELANFKDL